MTTKKTNRGGFAAVPDPAFAEGSTARLVTGHSLQWLKTQPSKSIPVFFFSPPYNKRRPGGSSLTGNVWNSQLADGYASFSDDLPHHEYVSWMHDLLNECWRVLTDDGAIFFQHKDQPFKGRLLTPEELIPTDILAHLRQRIIWHRQTAYTPNKNFLNPSFEFIHLLVKPKFKFATSGKLTDMLSIRPTKKHNPAHPAPMPVELPRRIFEQLKPEHDTICDVFSGSGTTGVAARATGRHYIGIELDAGYNAKAAERLDCTVETLAPPALKPPTKPLLDDLMDRKRAAYREFLAREKAAKEAAKAAKEAAKAVVQPQPANDDRGHVTLRRQCRAKPPKPDFVMQPEPDNDTGIRYGTLCSGIEAVSLAWDGLGFDPAFFSEVGKFQSAFLMQRYPTVPNVGDMTLIDGGAHAGKLDVLWASTPCQSHSRDGDRTGLRDPRGDLTLTAVKIADDIKPPVFVLENVVGFLNVENGDAFGDFLAQLVGEDQPLVSAGRRWTNAGAVRGPRRNVAWRVLDAQYGGLAQRRERLFIVACPVGGPDPAAILFEHGSPAHDLGQLQALQAAEAEAYAAGRSVMWFNGDPTPKFNEVVAYTLKANAGFGNLSGVLIDGEAYRLSPEDREALMGMPRGYTAIPGASDRQRNSALGNSLAVPDVRWLGQRIKAALREPEVIFDDFSDHLLAA